MPVRICVLTSVHQPFDGRIFYRECTALAQAGYDVTLVAPAEFGEEQREGITVLGVPRPARRWQRPLTWWRVYRRVRRLTPDVIHFHDPELLLLVPLLRLRFGRRVKVVYDVHEYFVDSLASKHWIPVRLRPAVAGVARRMERRLVRDVDGLVLAVEGQRDLYPQARGPVAVVRNLPLARLFEEAVPSPALDMPGLKLVYAGLILPQRGIDTLLEALHRLRQVRIEDVHLFLAGPDTSRAYRNEIDAFVYAHGLGRQVHWLGYVPHDELKHVLAAADVGLLPGRHTPQYSRPNIATKLFEYMLCGLPILTVDNPHWQAYVEEAEAGLVVPADDAAVHARAIRWLRDHPDEARAMGERGRVMVLDRYTWEQEQARLLELYRAILERE
jgi:glycosyltransferase involved in cell wall biosynthesis